MKVRYGLEAPTHMLPNFSTGSRIKWVQDDRGDITGKRPRRNKESFEAFI